MPEDPPGWETFSAVDAAVSSGSEHIEHDAIAWYRGTPRVPQLRGSNNGGCHQHWAPIHSLGLKRLQPLTGFTPSFVTNFLNIPDW